MYSIVSSKNVTDYDGDGILNSLGPGPNRIKIFGRLCRSILEKTDERLEKEIIERGSSLPIGESFVTESYGLDCKYIVHVITPFKEDDDEQLSKLVGAYLKAFQTAYDEGVRSILVPTIGAGANGYQTFESLKAAKESGYAFSKEHPNMDIFIDVYDVEHYVYETTMDISKVSSSHKKLSEDELALIRNQIIEFVQEGNYKIEDSLRYCEATHPSLPKQVIYETVRETYGRLRGFFDEESDRFPHKISYIKSKASKPVVFDFDKFHRHEKPNLRHKGIPDESGLFVTIDMEKIGVKEGDSFSQVINKFLEYGFKKKDPYTKQRKAYGWDCIKSNIGDLVEDYNDKVEDGTYKAKKKSKNEVETLENTLWGWHVEHDKHYQVWKRPIKPHIVLAGLALSMTKRQIEWLLSFCGYSLSKYEIHDIALQTCLDDILKNEAKNSDELVPNFLNKYCYMTGDSIYAHYERNTIYRKKK